MGVRLGPLMFGFVAVAIGGSSWVVGGGFVVSAVVLTVTALQLRARN